MTTIRAHFDGSVIVPDEPLHLPPHSKVIVLIDAESGAAAAALEQATREYYEQQSAEERAEDEAWGKAAATDQHGAWG